MANELVKIEQLPFAEIMTISKAFAESGMFADSKQAAQAFVKIQAGQEIGIPPFAAMSGIHIIQGKPTIGAGLMASRVKGSGKYDYKVEKHDKTICSIQFLQGNKAIGTSTFTLEDAKKAGTKNMDKFPENMLFARAMSNGVKWFCPDIFSGPVYTPEEMGDVEPVTEDITHTVITQDPPPTIPPVKRKATDKAINEAAERIINGESELYNKLIETVDLSEGQLNVLNVAKENSSTNQNKAA